MRGLRGPRRGDAASTFRRVVAAFSCSVNGSFGSAAAQAILRRVAASAPNATGGVTQARPVACVLRRGRVISAIGVNEITFSPF